MNILLVDDEATVREPLTLFLRELGHQVRAAASGEEALWLLQEAPAELVVTDLKMPGLSGIELLRRVRERWPTSEVVLVTGYGTMDDAVEALRLGAYDFLVKPVRLARLELLVAHCDERIRFSRDNRELREVVERLRELNQRKEKFISLANHELRTPATVAAGLVALLTARQADLPEDARRLLHGADRALRRLKAVVEDLGELGLAQDDALRVLPVAQPLAALVEELQELGAMYRDLRPLDLAVVCREPLQEPVCIDRPRVMRAASALVQNAVKYTPDGGRVEVLVHREGPHLAVAVSDTGIGVAEGERDKVFELFYTSADIRHHKTSGHEFGGGGLGVGLPLARAIARAHGGDVTIQPRDGGGMVATLFVQA